MVLHSIVERPLHVFESKNSHSMHSCTRPIILGGGYTCNSDRKKQLKTALRLQTLFQSKVNTLILRTTTVRVLRGLTLTRIMDLTFKFDVIYTYKIELFVNKN